MASSIPTCTQKAAKSRVTKTLLFVVVTASLGTWFTLGYNVVATNVTETQIVQWMRSVGCSRINNDTLDLRNQTHRWCRHIPVEDDPLIILSENSELNTLWAIVSSIFCFGGLASTFPCATLVNLYGPRKSLFITEGVLALGVIIYSLSPLANSYEMLIVGRLIIGMAMGMICAITPIYTCEVAPVSLRGFMGTVPSVMSVLGMITGTFLGLPYLLGSGTGWAILVALQMIPVLTMCVVLTFCPDSPTYLYVAQKNKLEAEKALVWLRRTTNIQDELLALERELTNSTCRDQLSILGIFKTPLLRGTLLICAVPMFCQQFSGYACVTGYSTAIFNGIGINRLNSIYTSLGLWATYLVFQLGSMLLVDRVGRRILLLTSQIAILLTFCLLVTGMALTKQGFSWTQYLSTACLFVYIASFAIGLASIPWILPNELFTQDARAAAMTLVGIVCFASALVTMFVFSVIVPYAQEYTFIIFPVSTLFSAIFVFFKVPETRKRSIEEIQAVLRTRFNVQKPEDA